MTNVKQRYRVGRTLIEERMVDGMDVIYYNGEIWVGTFHEAMVAAKQAPLISMRDECRRIAKEARAHIEQVRREDDLDGHDIEDAVDALMAEGEV